MVDKLKKILISAVVVAALAFIGELIQTVVPAIQSEVWGIVVLALLKAAQKWLAMLQEG